MLLISSYFVRASDSPKTQRNWYIITQTQNFFFTHNLYHILIICFGCLSYYNNAMLCYFKINLSLQVLILLTSFLPEVGTAGEASEQFLQLYQSKCKIQGSILDAS